MRYGSRGSGWTHTTTANDDYSRDRFKRSPTHAPASRLWTVSRAIACKSHLVTTRPASPARSVAKDWRQPGGWPGRGLSPTPPPALPTTRCPIRGVGGNPLRKTPHPRKCGFSAESNAPAAGREPPSPSPANPFLMVPPPGRPRLVHGRRAAPPRSPETSLSDEWSI